MPVSATTTSSCGASLMMAAILQLRPSCAKTLSPGKLGNSIFVVEAELFRSSLIALRDAVQMTGATYRPLPQGDPWHGANLGTARSQQQQ